MTSDSPLEARYLIEMYRALAALRAQLGDDAEFAAAKGPYEAYVRRLRRAVPPAKFVAVHDAFVDACIEMLRRLRSAQTVEGLGALEALTALAEPGAAAFREFQVEADRLGLGITFR